MDIRGGEEDFQQTNGRTATGHLSSGVGSPRPASPGPPFWRREWPPYVCNIKRGANRKKYSAPPPGDQCRVHTKKPTAPAGTMGRSAHRKCVDGRVSRWAWISTRSPAQQRCTEQGTFYDQQAATEPCWISHGRPTCRGRKRHGGGKDMGAEKTWGRQRRVASPRRRSVPRCEGPRDGIAHASTLPGYASTSSGSSSSTGRTSHISIVSMSA